MESTARQSRNRSRTGILPVLNVLNRSHCPHGTSSRTHPYGPGPDRLEASSTSVAASPRYALSVSRYSRLGWKSKSSLETCDQCCTSFASSRLCVFAFSPGSILNAKTPRREDAKGGLARQPVAPDDLKFQIFKFEI